MYWADSRGYLKGRKIGIYYPNDPASGALVNSTIKASLTRLGYVANAACSVASTTPVSVI